MDIPALSSRREFNLVITRQGRRSVALNSSDATDVVMDKAEEDSCCFLLSLPVDLLVVMMSMLPMSSVLRFLATCRRVRMVYFNNVERIIPSYLLYNLPLPNVIAVEAGNITDEIREKKKTLSLYRPEKLICGNLKTVETAVSTLQEYIQLISDVYGEFGLSGAPLLDFSLFMEMYSSVARGFRNMLMQIVPSKLLSGDWPAQKVLFPKRLASTVGLYPPPFAYSSVHFVTTYELLCRTYNTCNALFFNGKNHADLWDSVFHVPHIAVLPEYAMFLSNKNLDAFPTIPHFYCRYEMIDSRHSEINVRLTKEDSDIFVVARNIVHAENSITDCRKGIRALSAEEIARHYSEIIRETKVASWRIFAGTHIALMVAIVDCCYDITMGINESQSRRIVNLMKLINTQSGYERTNMDFVHLHEEDKMRLFWQVCINNVQRAFEDGKENVHITSLAETINDMMTICGMWGYPIARRLKDVVNALPRIKEIIPSVPHDKVVTYFDNFRAVQSFVRTIVARIQDTVLSSRPSKAPVDTKKRRGKFSNNVVLKSDGHGDAVDGVSLVTIQSSNMAWFAGWDNQRVSFSQFISFERFDKEKREFHSSSVDKFWVEIARSLEIQVECDSFFVASAMLSDLTTVHYSNVDEYNPPTILYTAGTWKSVYQLANQYYNVVGWIEHHAGVSLFVTHLKVFVGLRYYAFADALLHLFLSHHQDTLDEEELRDLISLFVWSLMEPLQCHQNDTKCLMRNQFFLTVLYTIHTRKKQSEQYTIFISTSNNLKDVQEFKDVRSILDDVGSMRCAPIIPVTSMLPTVVQSANELKLTF